MKIIIDGIEYVPVEIKKLLEDHNFRVSSEGWRKITVDDKEFLVNDEKDIWEINEGEYKGEQLFTWKAAMRETKKAGKEIPTIEELCDEDIENIVYAGYRNPSGSFVFRGLGTNLWSSSVSGSSAWDRGLGSGSAGVYRNPDSQAFGFSVRVKK